MKNTITKLKTNTMDAADIIRSMLNAYAGAWHTYEDELVNMYLDEDTTAVLSLRTGMMTIHEWSGRCHTCECESALDFCSDECYRESPEYRAISAKVDKGERNPSMPHIMCAPYGGNA